MSKFPLREKTITHNGQPIRVRELTHGQRKTFSEAVAADPHRGPAVMASLSCVDPVMTEAEAAEEPITVIELIVSEALKLSGMKSADG